jgi:acyl-CoA thioester hydrolase
MFSVEMDVKDEHIDFQGIVDGLYYPWYMEVVRHRFVKEVLGVDMEAAAREGLNWVLAEYTLKFKSSLKKGDRVTVTCELKPIEGSRSRFGFHQTIVRDGKVAAEALFTATCVPAAGGRPFIPEGVLSKLSSSLTVMCALLISSLLTACGGGGDSDSVGYLYVGGLWRGGLVLTENTCQLDLAPSYTFANSVSQSFNSIELRDGENRLFVGDLVGDDGFSVDALGPSSQRLRDGRLCSLTYRYRYDSINDDGDRTAQVRYLVVGECSDGSECQSEYAGDGLRG